MTPPWGVVLAGGEGVRLRPLVRQLCGDDRPKQFATIVGSKSLLQHTLDRVALAIPPQRTVIVTRQSHSDWIAQEFRAPPTQHILAQPEDRGTAAGILFPAHWIYSHDPHALIAVFPSDHFIPEDCIFMEHILRMSAFVRENPDRLVLLGARANVAETGYGWIRPGERLNSAIPMHRVKGFWEKPSAEAANGLLAEGCLWNTFVLVAKASTLIGAGRAALPGMTERLERIAASVAQGREMDIEREFGRITKADFSRDLLEVSLQCLAVSQLPAIVWSDLGTPERLLDSLQQWTSPSHASA